MGKGTVKALVLGDVIKFSSGDRIGADVRLVEASSLYIEESALTGESVPVQKKVEALQGQDVSIGDQKYGFYGYDDYTRVWNRSRCSNGYEYSDGPNCKYVANAEQMETPLQRRLEQLGKILNCSSYFDSACRVSWCVSRNEVYHMF